MIPTKHDDEYKNQGVKQKKQQQLEWTKNSFFFIRIIVLMKKELYIYIYIRVKREYIY